MNYNDEIISFFSTTLSGWDVTGYHSRSLFIIKNRHNFGHNLQVNDIYLSFEFLSIIKTKISAVSCVLIAAKSTQYDMWISYY